MSVSVSIEGLRAALARGELVFHYQPKVSLVLGTICGAEALIRWCKPDGTMIGPGAFIPLAESSGLITEITCRMLDTLAADMAIVQALDPELTLSFNASGRDFEDDRVIEAVLRLVELGAFAPSALEVEVTESAVLAGGPGMSERLGVLRASGVDLAMDDFGTGYSSIDMLSKLPFTAIKIDQGIVRRMETSQKDATIVESSIRMGHRLGLHVVGEGIETESLFHRLQAAGCTIGQGYWMGRPMPLERFIDLLRSGERFPAGAIGLLHMATLDHLEWRKTLIDALVSDGGQFQVEALRRFEVEPTECRLGRWYHGAGRVLADVSAYVDLDEPHLALHACAKQVIEASNGGATFGELLPTMRRLAGHSIRIVALLQELEHAALTRMVDVHETRAERAAGSERPLA